MNGLLLTCGFDSFGVVCLPLSLYSFSFPFISLPSIFTVDGIHSMGFYEIFIGGLPKVPGYWGATVGVRYTTHYFS